jgi:hypothetical protein
LIPQGLPCGCSLKYLKDNKIKTFIKTKGKDDAMVLSEFINKKKIKL